MARAAARKKTTGGKSHHAVRPTTKAGSTPKMKARNKKADLQKSAAKSKVTLKMPGKVHGREKKRTAATAPAAGSDNRNRTEPAGHVAIAEKAPRLLVETKSTSAALAVLEKGIKHIYQKDLKKARQELFSLLKSHPKETEILARARTYLQICDREESARKRPVITNDQLYALGVMEHNRGNFAGAISHFHQLLEKQPGGDHIHYSLAASLARSGNIAEALISLRQAIGMNEDNRIYAKNDSDFESLHTNREFAALVGLMQEQSSGLPQS